MKIKGKKIQGANSAVVVIPRQSGDLVFKVQAVLSFEDFEKLNPTPKAPIRLLPGNIRQENVEDPGYKARVQEWGLQKFAWLFLKALSATEDLEWEIVKLDDPTTWTAYTDELKDAGLAPAEVNVLESAVLDVCGLNSAKIEEATKRFLAGLEAAEGAQSTPASAAVSTPSGELASASA